MVHLGRTAGVTAEGRPVVGPTPHTEPRPVEGEGQGPRSAAAPTSPAPAEHLVRDLPPSSRAFPLAVQAPVQHGSNLLNILIDPSKMLLRRPETAEAEKPRLDDEDVEEIEVCIGSKPTRERPTLRAASIMTPHDEEMAKRLCRRINPQHSHEIFSSMVDALLVARHEHEQRWRARNASLPLAWHQEPWYCIDPRFFATPDASRIARLDETASSLEYVRDLGFKNILLLQHYETDWLTGGHGVVAYATAKVLGGEDAFSVFMNRSHELGLRVVTTAAINHTSIHHEWFRRALQGDAEKLAYYHQVPGMQRLGEIETGGQVFCHYHDVDGRRSVRRFHEPDFVPHDHLVTATCGGQSHLFYSSLRPYQVDLELRSPKVLGEIFRLLGREVTQGVLGKHTDAVAYWIKKPGTSGYGLDDSHTLLALIKLFLRLIGTREIIIPNVVSETAGAARYCGRETEVHDVPTSSEGDAFFWAKGSLALREALYLRDRRPLEAAIREIPRLPRDTSPIVYLENQDEIPLELASSPGKAQKMQEHIRAHGGGIFKNGLAAGCRHADCLDHDPARIAVSIFSLFMLPATPLVYYGTEIGTRNNIAHARLMRKWRHEYYQRMGVDLPESACHDPSSLQRGAVPTENLRRATAANYPPLELLRKLNVLWAKNGSLRSSRLHMLEHDKKAVLAWIKRSPDDKERALLMIANLTDAVTELRLAAFALETLAVHRGGPVHRLVDMLADERVLEPSEVRFEGKEAVVRLGPYQYRAISMAA